MKDSRISLVAGFVAGVAEVLIGYPFDTVKTRLQIQDKDSTPRGRRTPWGCARGMLREEGLLAFYRGIAAPMVQEALGVALLFGARDWLRNNTGADISRPGAFVLACCLIGLLESLIYCPLDHLKARIQAWGQREKEREELMPQVLPKSSREVALCFPPAPCPRPRGIASHAHGRRDAEEEGAQRHARDLGVEAVTSPSQGMRAAAAGDSRGDLACVLLCAQAVVRAKGLIGLYLGFMLQALKEMLGNIALFGAYDVVLAALSGGTSAVARVGGRHPLQGPSWGAIWPAGSLAGMAYYVLSHPIDTIKSKLQTDSLSSPRYRGSLHCLRRVAFHETASISDLFCGLSLCLARAIPGCAIQFFVFEFVFKTLTDLSSVVGDTPQLSARLHHWQILDLLSGWS